MKKSDLRVQLRKRRRSLTNTQQGAAAKKLSARFIQQRFHLRYQTVGFYWPVDGEISPLPLLQKLIQMRMRCFLPILHPFGKNVIRFGEFREGSNLVKNRYGICEPTHSKQISICALDLILMPIVGFDKTGNRLGMGAGFYDRSLAFTKLSTHGPKLIGLAHQCQQVERLDADSWDIPIHGILTDDGYLKVSKSY